MTDSAADKFFAAARPHRGIITVCVIAASLLQVLDSTIANVALPHMQGSLSATTDQISWVLTSYLIAAAIVMPPSRGWPAASGAAALSWYRWPALPWDPCSAAPRRRWSRWSFIG
ncbi:MAG: hypothetical protein WDN04_16145 [Rhodospirillales bacterium]